VIPIFLAQDKDCETVDGEMEVQVIDRCAGERAACNSLYRFQERFAVAFIAASVLGISILLCARLDMEGATIDCRAAGCGAISRNPSVSRVSVLLSRIRLNLE
jgi:hypothetical protein